MKSSRMTIDRVARPIGVGMLLFGRVVGKSSRNDGFLLLPLSRLSSVVSRSLAGSLLWPMDDVSDEN